MIIAQESKKKTSQASDETIEEFTNQILNKINLSLNKFSYNVIVANLHEIYNFFNKILDGKIINKNLIKNYTKILTIMLPITPHLANECLGQISDNKTHIWPEINQKYLKNKKHNIVVQINGKKRGLIFTETSVGEKDLINKIKKMKDLQNFLDGKNIIKSIYIKDRLINLILK